MTEQLITTLSDDVAKLVSILEAQSNSVIYLSDRLGLVCTILLVVFALKLLVVLLS